MYKKKPFFIVFEGVEGCGKSYQSKKLFNKLKKKNSNYINARTWWYKKFRIDKKFDTKRLLQ